MLLLGRQVTVRKISNAFRVELAKSRAHLLPHGAQHSKYGPRLANRRADQTFGFCVAGSYGDLIPSVLKSQRGPFVFLDIGANVGVFSLVAAGLEGCRRIFAFEPVPQTFSVLVENIALNRAAKVTPICAALVSGDETFVHMDYHPEHSGTSAISDHGGVLALAMSAPDIDKLVGDLPERVVAKIDVEGAELAVLAALERCSFFPRLTDIIVEVSRLKDSETADHLLAQIATLGFQEVRRSTTEPRHYDAHFRRAGVN
ncbi:MAG TPA: FkbM family methyltransferase [Bauldia sp.]|nr:FkbM family methyltransferase [Bauldia sp.]